MTLLHTSCRSCRPRTTQFAAPTRVFLVSNGAYFHQRILIPSRSRQCP
uniref:Uncharacterized protein n=1 Tax=Anguilla anguilla TaxID=7936 RepID=A0A0E9Q7Z6_ANGAN